MSEPTARRRRLLPFLVATGLATMWLPATAGGETARRTTGIHGRCVGASEADQAAVAGLQLSGFAMDVSTSMPAVTRIGEPVEVTVALSYDLSELTALGAGQLGIDTVDLTGTQFPIELMTPGNDPRATATPADPIVDARRAASIGLGSATFDVPTDRPGALHVGLGTARLVFAAAPAGPRGSATCEDAEPNDLPYGFVVDPLAPVIDPAVRAEESDGTTATVDLAATVLPGAGPVLADSWRVVRTIGEGGATIDSDGQLSYEFAGAGLDIVWEVCGAELAAVPTAPSPTVTSDPEADSTHDTALDPVADTGTGTASDPTDDGSDAGSETAPYHCAQGVVTARPPVTRSSEVLSSSITGDGGDTSAATGTGASLAFTG